MLDNIPPDSTQLIIGTYTEELPHVKGKATGILACLFKEGVVGSPTVVAPCRNPSWVTVTSSGKYLYSVNETKQYEGGVGGGVTAYARDPSTGALTPLNSRPSDGVEPAYIALDTSERFVLVANFRSGSMAVFARNDDGSLGDLVGRCQHTGSSAHPIRQAGPHPHMIALDPVTGNVLVPDLGLDAIVVYELDDMGQLAERTSERINTKAGAGPRHIAFHPNQSSLFILNELDNTLVALHRGADGFEVTDLQSTLPPDFQDRNQSAAIRVSLSGRYVFTSNRGHDSIAIFEFEETAGTLRLRRLVPVAGQEPRDFCLSSDGQYLLVANQNTDSIVTLAVDEDGANLNKVSVAEVPSPVCLVFAP